MMAAAHSSLEVSAHTHTHIEGCRETTKCCTLWLIEGEEVEEEEGEKNKHLLGNSEDDAAPAGLSESDPVFSIMVKKKK